MTRPISARRYHQKRGLNPDDLIDRVTLRPEDWALTVWAAVEYNPRGLVDEEGIEYLEADLQITIYDDTEFTAGSLDDLMSGTYCQSLTVRTYRIDFIERKAFFNGMRISLIQALHNGIFP